MGAMSASRLGLIAVLVLAAGSATATATAACPLQDAGKDDIAAFKASALGGVRLTRSNLPLWR